MKYRITMAILFFIFLLSVAGCQTSVKDAEEKKEQEQPSNQEIPDYYHGDFVFVPEAKGSHVQENEDILYDLSHVEQGYMVVKTKTESADFLLQLTGQDGVTYTYHLPKGQEAVIPFTAGDGTYYAIAYRNIQEQQYAMSLEAEVEVALENPVIPFLYPSLYVNFDTSMEAVQLAKKLTENKSALEAVNEIFTYVTENVSYDYDKAQTVQSGYLPVIDDTLKEKKGICFDYSALMTAMLRSVGIPTRLDIGYSHDVYHAWISVYFEEQGWVNKMMEFDGQQWNLMDPTLAASSYSDGGDYEIEMAEYNLEYVH